MVRKGRERSEQKGGKGENGKWRKGKGRKIRQFDDRKGKKRGKDRKAK